MKIDDKPFHSDYMDLVESTAGGIWNMTEWVVFIQERCRGSKIPGENGFRKVKDLECGFCKGIDGVW